jgi:UDP-N-acetylmuramate dehydrogenase
MQSKEIVVALIVTFRSKKNFDEILASMNQNEADRHTKQHFLFPSCGSTFKNNYSIGKPSGRIFDELGLKGTKVGNAEISTFHGNFVFNKGSAQAVDVMSLAHLMRSKALENKMDLELEVQPIGCFDKKLAHDLALERLDPATIETSDGKVLTGILHSGETKAIECKQDENLDEILDEAPAIDSAFLGWTQEMSAQLGTLRFQVTRIDSLKDGAHKTLQIKFIAESPAHYERLISAAPELSGFQDKLWETSVFECFIFSADSEKYLELEVHSEDSWLALKLDSHRKRNKKSLIPSEDDFTGIRPFALLENETIEYSKSQSKRIGLGFEIELSILQQLLGTQENFCLIRGAYAHGPQKLYAIAPGLGFVEENEKPQPDFHKRSGVFHIRLFDTMHKK